MNKAEQFIYQKLAERADQGILRSLPASEMPIDFCSNDYLGFARSAKLRESAERIFQQLPQQKNGATGSRLISGNTAFTEETEIFIARFHHAENGLFFNSGYDANVGLISSLAQRGDTIILDQLAHASLIDGARLTHANRYAFRHNDLNDLETKLKIAKGNVYVLIESIYSMDGDMAPLREIVELCGQYDANLIVDEAHALGVFGNHGQGIVQQQGLEHRIFARIMTFGKALGCHGAIVLGGRTLRDYLVNFARPFIYSTAAPPHSVAMIKAAYGLLIDTDHSELIKNKIIQYTTAVKDAGLDFIKPTPGLIQTIRYDDNTAAKSAAIVLQDKGLNVRAIVSPTVPSGKERLRICLHTFNTSDEIDRLIAGLKNIQSNE